MDDSAAVSRIQCIGDLPDDVGHLIAAQLIPASTVGERSTPQVTHDQPGRPRLTPVVVERNDPRMLEPGHQMGLGLEPADELGTVRKLLSDHLDRDLAVERRLPATEHHGVRAVADPLQQLVPVAAARRTGDRRSHRRGRSGAEDRSFDGCDLIARVEPEVGGETSPVLLEHTERFGGPPAAVQCLHEQAMRALSQRLTGDDPGEVGHGFAHLSLFEQRPPERFVGDMAELRQSRREPAGPVLVLEPRERGAAPQIDRSAKPVRRDSIDRRTEQQFEDVCVDRLRRHSK